jgi:F-type H+-transporting ATPase subunit gamma
MAAAQEIRNKIKLIQNTQKITRAMEMVAASKMHRAQLQMRAARPYAEKICNVVAHVAKAHTEYRHPYLLHRATYRVGFIVISTDRGLCGGLNVFLFREILRSMRSWLEKGASIELCVIGNKARLFFKRLGASPIAQASRLGDLPTPETLIGVVKIMLDAYAEGRIDRLFLAYNTFMSKMIQKPRIQQLIPIPTEAEGGSSDAYWDYLYEPEAGEILKLLFDRYIECQVYHGMVENIACEMAARMIAMKSATDNATNLIEAMQLAYNKARQEKITQELSEIVGGAAAL